MGTAWYVWISLSDQLWWFLPIYLLNPSCYFTERQVQRSACCPHCVYVFCMSHKQPATDLCNINRLVLCKLGWKCLLRGTHESLHKTQTRLAITGFTLQVCFPSSLETLKQKHSVHYKQCPASLLHIVSLQTLTLTLNITNSTDSKTWRFQKPHH
jgi:hypothetical protein